MSKSPLIVLAAAALMSLTLGIATILFTAQPGKSFAQELPWLTYTSDDAAYTFDYPEGSIIDTSQDASLRFKIVYVQFPVTDTGAYQGVSILVLENPADEDMRKLIETRYDEAEQKAPAAIRRAAAFAIDGAQAVKLARDPIAGDHDKYSVFLAGKPGNKIAYRINLFGSGKGGDSEPSPQTLSYYDKLLSSFKLTNNTLRPQSVVRRPFSIAAAAAVDPPIANVFTYPLRSGTSQGYGVPTGIIQGGTHMEWLDYGIRNFDQWRIRCYGVDWSRMIHTGEDWYRNDYLTANTAGAPVYAIADGVVARHSTGISYPGNVVIIRHRLANGRDIYSMYGHVTNVSVVQGELVKHGQQIATVFSQGYTGRATRLHPTWDSHIHFEMRYFLDGTNIYVPGTNAYGYNYPGCTYAYPGRGYTYIIHPDAYPYPNQGYVDGSDFIAAHLAGDNGGSCTPLGLLSNGNFELGRTIWSAANSAGAADPLIYTTRPRTGRWSGWLGNRLSYIDTLSQQVNIPAGSNTLTLKFWRYVASKEAAGNSDDRMTITLIAPDGSTIGTPGLVTSAAPRNVWAQEVMQFNVTNAAYTTATLKFVGNNDADLVSSFFLDDMTLTRECPIALAAQIMQPLLVGDSTITPTATITDTPTPQVTPSLTPDTPTPQVTPSLIPDTLTPESTPSLTPDTPTPQVTPPLPPITTSVYLPVLIGLENLPDDANAPEKLVFAPVCRDHVVNGDFEASATSALPWTGIANTSSTIYNVIPGASGSGLNDPLLYSNRARSGLRSGRVGSANVNGYWNELVQTVKLPAGVTSVTLSYWRFLDSVDSTTAAKDSFSAGLETDKGIEIVTPQRFTNASAGRGSWVQQSLSLPNAADYAGQSLWLSFKGRTDGSGPTSLYLDDIQLIVCAAQ